MTDKIFKAWTNVPIPLGGGFVEGDAPSDSVTTDQLLRYLTLCRQIEFGPHDDDWYWLMGEGGSGEESGRRRQGDDETESSLRSMVYAYPVITS